VNVKTGESWPRVLKGEKRQKGGLVFVPEESAKASESEKSRFSNNRRRGKKRAEHHGEIVRN